MYNNHIFWNYYVSIHLNLYCFSQIELVQNYSPLFSTNRTSTAVDLLWLNVENIEEFTVVIYNDYHSEKLSMNIIIIIVLLLSYNG